MARTVPYKTINIPESTHERLVELSESTGMSLSKLVDIVIRRTLDDIENTSQPIQFSMKKIDGETVVTLL